MVTHGFKHLRHRLVESGLGGRDGGVGRLLKGGERERREAQGGPGSWGGGDFANL